MGPRGQFSLSRVSKNGNRIVRNRGVGGSFGMESAIQPLSQGGVGGSLEGSDSTLAKRGMKRSHGAS